MRIASANFDYAQDDMLFYCFAVCISVSCCVTAILEAARAAALRTLHFAFKKPPYKPAAKKIRKNFQKTLDKTGKVWYTCKAFCFTAKKDVEKMFEKNLKIGFLLDFYGEVLSDRKRTVLDYYYNDDLSLAEIAEEIGISRQGVRELIKKAEDELRFYEEKLGLAERFRSTQESAQRLLKLLEDAEIGGEIHCEAQRLADTVRS